MLKKVLISIIAILFAYVAFSQESTTLGKPRLESSEETVELGLDAVEEPIVIKYEKVLIMPFEPKLYISEADREISRKTGLAPSQIRNNFRWGINNILWAEINPIRPAISLLSADDLEVQKDLHYLYQSIGYHYQTLSEEKEEVGKTKTEEVYDKMKNKISSTLRPQPEEEQPGTRIKNGQLYSVAEKRERYMHTRIINPNALELLSNKYEVGYFVFINQFDIKIAPGVDQRQLESEMYPREIKVHYTIMDQFGAEIYAGAAKGFFPSTINDMNRIVKGHLPKVAKQIAAHIPPYEMTNAMEEKIQIDEEKANQQRESLEEAY